MCVAAGWTWLPGGFVGAEWRENDLLAFRRRADGRGRQGISDAQLYCVLFVTVASARWSAVARSQSVGNRCERKVVVFGLRVYKSN